MAKRLHARKMNKKTFDIIAWCIVGVCGFVAVLFIAGVFPVDRVNKDILTEIEQPEQSPAATAPVSPGSAQSVVPSPSDDSGLVNEETPPPTNIEEESTVPSILTNKPSADPRIRYDVALTLYDDMRRLHGAMKVYYTNTTPNELYELVFHLHPNAFLTPDSAGSQAESRSYPGMRFSKGETIISSVGIDGKLTRHIESTDRLLLRVPFTASLLPGEEVEVLIEFAVDVPVIDARFGYTELGYQLGNFLPVLAVYQDGAWVEDGYAEYGDSFYAEAADYAIALSYPDTYALACTGSIISEEKSGGMITSIVRAAKVRDFACMLTKGMRVAEDKYKNVTIKSYALSDGSTVTGLNHAKYALELYDELIGAYPYDTLTIAQAEMFAASGMEYTSFMMIQRTLYLKGKENELQLAISHETAHQYFFALVGSDPINAPWVDEAITTYFGLLPFERQNESTFFQLRKVLFYDRMADGKRVDGALSDYASNSEYAASVYWKGGAMYDDLRRELGDDMFFAAVRSYVNSHSYRIAVKQDIIGAFEKASGKDLEGFFYEWLSEPIEAEKAA